MHLQNPLSTADLQMCQSCKSRVDALQKKGISLSEISLHLLANHLCPTNNSRRLFFVSGGPTHRVMTRPFDPNLDHSSPFVLGPTNGSALSGGFSRFSWTVHRGFFSQKKDKEGYFPISIGADFGRLSFQDPQRVYFR